MTLRLFKFFFFFAFLDNRLINIPIAKYAHPCLFSQGKKKILEVKLLSQKGVEIFTF